MTRTFTAIQRKQSEYAISNHDMFEIDQWGAYSYASFEAMVLDWVFGENLPGRHNLHHKEILNYSVNDTDKLYPYCFYGSVTYTVLVEGTEKDGKWEQREHEIIKTEVYTANFKIDVELVKETESVSTT